MKLLIFDTETTGLPKSRELATHGPNNWPHLVSIAWVIVENDKILKTDYHIVKPEWNIPEDSTKIHGITNEKAHADGEPLIEVLRKFFSEEHDVLVAHNMNFDYNVLVNAVLWDARMKYPLFKRMFCTMDSMTNVMKLPAANGRGFKPPKLVELYAYTTQKQPQINQLHNSLYDTQLLAESIIASSVLKSMISLHIPSDGNPNVYKKARHTLII
jgi:DNA polymerase III epsilon subunit-like protein